MKIKSKDGCAYEFPSHKWLASSVGDGKISREIFGKGHCRNLDSPPTGNVKLVNPNGLRLLGLVQGFQQMLLGYVRSGYAGVGLS